MYGELFHILNDGSFEENVRLLKEQLDRDLAEYRRFWGSDR